MNAAVTKEYDRWCALTKDDELCKELEEIKGEEEKISDAFFKSLEFGTGGLRGIIGAGTNRLNVYTVRRASLGLGNFIKNQSATPSAVIGYDTRIKSDVFAKTTAEALASLGIKVWLFTSPLPTPILSYAVRELKCSAGVMITASHNPAEYNGYKVYGADGCQITDNAAKAILKEIEKVDYFTSDENREKSEGGDILTVQSSLYESYLGKISELSVLYGAPADKSISIIYTPLNGTGLIPVSDVLKNNGFSNVTLVKEQAEHDGNFPTCKYPNPELKEAMQLALDYANRTGADLILATDPDCDRVGVGVKSSDGYKLLSGNEVGAILLDYVLSQKKEHGKLPDMPVAIKTIVTSSLASSVASDYGVEILDFLTGFKYIGEKIGELESRGELHRYVFGFEESCGYLSGTHARDKDGVNAALLIAEVCAFCKAKNTTLLSKLEELYQKHGYVHNYLFSYSLLGEDGLLKMKKAMQALRDNEKSFCGMPTIKLLDYKEGINGLPKSDVICAYMQNAKVTVRPSGTEPKIKIYAEITGEKERAEKELCDIKECIDAFIKSM